MKQTASGRPRHQTSDILLSAFNRNAYIIYIYCTSSSIISINITKTWCKCRLDGSKTHSQCPSSTVLSLLNDLQQRSCLPPLLPPPSLHRVCNTRQQYFVHKFNNCWLCFHYFGHESPGCATANSATWPPTNTSHSVWLDCLAVLTFLHSTIN